MHILFLTDNFPPEINAPASRTHEHAREWVKLGHAVTVITCAPNFPKGRVYEGYKNNLWQSEHIDGIRVVRVWSFITANEGFAKRILDYVSYMVTSFLASFFVRKVDVVVGTSPQFFTAVSAWMVSGFKRKPFVFELRDLWPESIRAVGAMQESKVLDAFEKLELFLYRRADAIVSVTNSFKVNLVGRGVDGDKIHVVTNGVDSSKFTPQEKDSELVEELGLNGKFVAGYIGTHGMAHALDAILQSAKITQESSQGSQIHYLFLGGGAEKAKLQNLASELQLRNVTFVDSVPKSDVARYWSILDVSIVHLRKTDLFKTVIPSKIFECMGMGIPILHGVEGESANIVVRSGAGKLVEPENSKEIADTLIELSGDPVGLVTMSKNGIVASLEFDRSSLAEKLVSQLERLSK